MNEKEIIQRVQKGDAQAFEHLIQSYHEVTWKLVRVLLKDKTIIEDVLQEAWLDVWRGIPSYQSERPFRPWLLTIVANRCRMTQRRATQTILSLEQEQVDTEDESNDTLRAILQQETRHEIQDAIAQLSEDQQRVLQLRYFAELELNEIAILTSAPLGTIQSRLHRAIGKLRCFFLDKRVAAISKERVKLS